MPRGNPFGGGMGGGNPFGGMNNPFGPTMMTKLAANPRFLPYLADDKFRAKLEALQRDPNALTTVLQELLGQGAEGKPTDKDPRMQDVIQYLLSGTFGNADNMEEDDNNIPKPFPTSSKPSTTSNGSSSSSSSHSSSSSSKPVPTPLEEHIPQDDGLTPEERQAKKERKAKANARKEEGNVHYKAKRFTEALEAYKAAQEIDPEEITYLLNEAAVYFEQNDMDKCIATCEKAKEKGREVQAPFSVIAKAFARMGNAYSKKGDLQAAKDAYESSLMEHRTEEVQDKLKKLKAELKQQTELAYRDPVKAEEAKERGNELFKAGKFPDAIEAYSEAIKRAPDNARYYTNRATARAKLMDFAGSQDDAEKAIKIDPTYAKAYVKLGNAQLQTKEYHKALETFKKALELEDSNVEAKDGLRRTIMKINESSVTDTDDPERAKRALADPEIQSILRDPMVNQLLEDAKTDPAVLQRAITTDKNMAAKIQKLIASGILRIG